MNPVWRKEYLVRRSEVDFTGHCRLDVLQQCFQQAAGDHALAVMAPLGGGIAWILARVQAHMRDYPAMDEPFEVETRFAGIRGPFFLRAYEAIGADGTVLAEASSEWLILDLETRRPIRPSDVYEGWTRMDVEPTAPIGRIRQPGTEPELWASREVRYSDVDGYGHMNNARYVSWITDCYPFGRHREYAVETLTISYAREALPGAAVDLYFAADPDGDYVAGRQDGEKLFEARLTWRRR